MMFILQVLLFIFSIIRRNVWDYGRLALLADHEGSVHELTWFIDPWNFLWFLWSDLFCKSEMCPSGSTIHHAVAMDTCHPLMSMNWYVKQHLKHQFYLQTFFISDHISCEAPIEHSLISFFQGCCSWLPFIVRMEWVALQSACSSQLHKPLHADHLWSNYVCLCVSVKKKWNPNVVWMLFTTCPFSVTCSSFWWC